MDGALLINKHAGVSSFGIIELLQRQSMRQLNIKKRDLPKIGHGGTLDPFATGLLVVLVGRSVKLARYFLGSTKVYEGIIRFGETTIPGDPTDPISETCTYLPSSLEQLREFAHQFTLSPYLQTPPMHSAKKRNGKPLYELARQGIEVDREAKSCQIYDFQIQSYAPPQARFEVKCSSGTYIRTLTQDFAKNLGSLGLLETLHRTSSGVLSLTHSWTMDQIAEASDQGRKWNELPCWVPFDRLLDSYNRATTTPEEKLALIQGKQGVLINILKRVEGPQAKEFAPPGHTDCLAIYCENSLIAVARRDENIWTLERVFASSESA